MSYVHNGYTFEGGSSALTVVDQAAAVAPVVRQGGVLRDANGALVTTTDPATPPLVQGSSVDSDGYLVVVPYASLVAPAIFSNGFLRDANGAMVTVTVALAAAPTIFQNGFLRDANGALVIP